MYSFFSQHKLSRRDLFADIPAASLAHKFAAYFDAENVEAHAAIGFVPLEAGTKDLEVPFATRCEFALVIRA